MTAWLAALPIESTAFIAPIVTLAVVLVTVLLLPAPGARRPRLLPWIGTLAAAAVLGAGAGGIAVWSVTVVQDLFGVAASMTIWLAVMAAGAGTGIAVVNIVRARWWRRAVAVLTLGCVVVAGAAVVNRDVGYFPRLGDALGVTAPGSLALGRSQAAPTPLRAWRAPAGMPRSGVIGSVRIPATASHFLARNAYVYLPPAARTPRPPALPVVIAFSGQPGAPGDVVNAGALQSTVDSIARAHAGLAPIVVVADQLGPSQRNTMCVDSSRGNVATYVTVDVRTWILKHLPVSKDRRLWTVAGFSQGGTCAVQFGAGYPALFGSFLDVSGQIAPLSGSVATTMKAGFGGSRTRYEQAKPTNLLRTRQPYPPTRALFAVGADDQHYRPVAVQLTAAARAAGMRAELRVIPGSHNWHLATAGLAWGFQALLPWWGVA